jgi:hypothetical protein
MTLYLQKRGCDFFHGDDVASQSDLGNYRLFLEFIDRDGKRICGDVMRGDRREVINGKAKTVSRNGLYTDFGYQCHRGCYHYVTDVGCLGEYTQADVLRVVNRYSAVQYGSIAIVDELPTLEYPEDVLELERAYLEREHAAMVEEYKAKIRENFIFWYTGSRWDYRKMTPEERKACTLLAFDEMVKRYGAVLEPGRTPAHLIARHMVAYLMEQDDIADGEFVEELRMYSPYYIGHYQERRSNGI